MAQRAYLLTGEESLKGVGKLLQEPEKAGTDSIKALFLMLMNMDMPVKEYMCSPGDPELLKGVLNWRGILGTARSAKERREAEDVLGEREFAYSQLGLHALGPEKARVFFGSLREVVKAWMASETLTPARLLRDVREEYLIS